jgi:hypothetical protein
MKKFKIIYHFGKSYGATYFEIENHVSYDEIIEKAIIKTIAEREDYFKLFPDEKNIKSTIEIIECDTKTDGYVDDGLYFRVPWS